MCVKNVGFQFEMVIHAPAVATIIEIKWRWQKRVKQQIEHIHGLCANCLPTLKRITPAALKTT